MFSGMRLRVQLFRGTARAALLQPGKERPINRQHDCTEVSTTPGQNLKLTPGFALTIYTKEIDMSTKMVAKETKMFSTRFPLDLWKRVRAYCDPRGVKLRWFVERAIEEKLAKEKK